MRSDHLSKHKRTHKKGLTEESIEEDKEDKDEDGLIVEDDGQDILEINIDGMPSMQIVKNVTYPQDEDDYEDEESKEPEEGEWDQSKRNYLKGDENGAIEISMCEIY